MHFRLVEADESICVESPFTDAGFKNCNGGLLALARARAGLTATKLADVCGWSRTKQSRIEAEQSVLTKEEYEALSRALADCGVEFE